MLSSSDAVVSSMNVFAIVLFDIRDKIFFCARNPMSRALNALSVMTRSDCAVAPNTKKKRRNVHWKEETRTNKKCYELVNDLYCKYVKTKILFLVLKILYYYWFINNSLCFGWKIFEWLPLVSIFCCLRFFVVVDFSLEISPVF